MEGYDKKLEDKLVEDGKQLLSNGHRMIYVFKYVRERAADETMHESVMKRLTEDQQVQAINQDRLENYTGSAKLSTTEIVIGSGMIGLAIVLTIVLWNMGWVSTLPIIIIGMALGVWGKQR